MSAKNANSHLRVRMLCEGAMMVALAQVLSYIKLMELPNGGSLTPAMLTPREKKPCSPSSCLPSAGD